MILRVFRAIVHDGRQSEYEEFFLDTFVLHDEGVDVDSSP